MAKRKKYIYIGPKYSTSGYVVLREDSSRVRPAEMDDTQRNALTKKYPRLSGWWAIEESSKNEEDGN